MPHTLRSKATSSRSVYSVALFLLVYVGVLTVVFAPRDVFVAQSGTEIRLSD
ncbi:MAG: hypothetical protein U1E06_11580 [Tabrizicola sp.]|uniref:hypothetical protein n=1 Tax=Tabrizicola sp. TaxID=2005166 RepID=UPI002737054B|nr:hypothetical protein [Tabrizicola sp.]MDP3261401.1 hypothetical protein [Tabrizicola sp.]MDP3649190.1 hypothetical protein [Paracoccaceae bacterium]MDZ4067465.1 hypothetical protein [Tabrizicola sp.]